MQNSIPKELTYSADTLGVCPERLEVLDNYLKKQIEDKKHPFIAFRVARRGSMVYRCDYGTQNPKGDPLLPDAIYPLQSVTKAFVAACAAILQEDGLLDYTDQLQKHFPEFKGENKEGVLLMHLLCHTSGINETEIDKYSAEILGERPENAEDDWYYKALLAARAKLGLPEAEGDDAADEAWEAIALRAPLAANPGTQFSYLSFGYSLIKTLIERKTGETLEAFARRRIFEPLGMSDTHWVLPEEKRNRFVLRDESFKGGAYMNSVEMMTNTGAGGGLKSSMDDLLSFGQMFLQKGKLGGKRIMSPASVRMMTVDRNEKVPDSFWFGRWMSASWGLGWVVKNGKIDDGGFLRGERTYDHGGYGGARLYIDPDEELVAAIYMCEQDEMSVYDDMGPAVNILYSALD